MDPLRAAALFVLLTFGALCGCQHPEPSGSPAETNAPPRPANYAQHVRNNSASLLYDLLNDEKHLSKLLIVKVESDPLDRLITDISAFAAEGARRLDELAAADRTLYLKETSLPSGEVAARDAVAKTKTHELLGAKGGAFEFRLLLSQIEALSYGRHLAQVAAENEPRPASARVFSELNAELKRLYDRTLAMAEERRSPR